MLVQAACQAEHENGTSSNEGQETIGSANGSKFAARRSVAQRDSTVSEAVRSGRCRDCLHRDINTRCTQHCLPTPRQPIQPFFPFASTQLLSVRAN